MAIAELDSQSETNNLWMNWGAYGNADNLGGAVTYGNADPHGGNGWFTILSMV